MQTLFYAVRLPDFLSASCLFERHGSEPDKVRSEIPYCGVCHSALYTVHDGQKRTVHFFALCLEIIGRPLMTHPGIILCQSGDTIAGSCREGKETDASTRGVNRLPVPSDETAITRLRLSPGLVNRTVRVTGDPAAAMLHPDSGGMQESVRQTGPVYELPAVPIIRKRSPVCAFPAGSIPRTGEQSDFPREKTALSGRKAIRPDEVRQTFKQPEQLSGIRLPDRTLALLPEQAEGTHAV